jgi:predicted NBD/HSP70 family sugar kinase
MLDHAVALGRIAATVATIIDPSVLVLGGGLSRNPEFVALISEEFSKRITRTRLCASEKGIAATVEGATILARDYVLGRLLGNVHRPISSRPNVWNAAEAASDFAPQRPS